MSTTEYALFDKDSDAGFAHNGVTAKWRCGVCRRAEGEDRNTDEAFHYITACEHVVRGDETHRAGEADPEPGSVEIAYEQGQPGDRPMWDCADSNCGLVTLCGDCWSNL